MRKEKLIVNLISFGQHKLSIFLTAVILLLALSTHAQSQPTIHIVFDLDWTLINPTTEEMARVAPENTIRFGNEIFRFSAHAVDVLIALHSQPGVEISFFSGGQYPRNQAVVDALYKMIHDKMQSTIYKPHRILSFEHLTQVSTDKTLHFPQRYKKDISRYFDPRYSVLVDDVQGFIMDGLEHNELWLGKTYNDRPHFNLAQHEDPKDAGYSAPNYAEWLRDRNKLLTVKDILLKAIHLTRLNSKIFLENLQPLRWKTGSCRALL